MNKRKKMFFVALSILMLGCVFGGVMAVPTASGNVPTTMRRDQAWLAVLVESNGSHQVQANSQHESRLHQGISTIGGTPSNTPITTRGLWGRGPVRHVANSSSRSIRQQFHP